MLIFCMIHCKCCPSLNSCCYRVFLNISSTVAGWKWKLIFCFKEEENVSTNKPEVTLNANPAEATRFNTKTNQILHKFQKY